MRWFKRNKIKSGPFEGQEYATWKEALFWTIIGCFFVVITEEKLREIEKSAMSVTSYNDLVDIARTDLPELANYLRKVTSALQDINGWLVCHSIASPEDMAQSFAYFEELSRTALEDGDLSKVKRDEEPLDIQWIESKSAEGVERFAAKTKFGKLVIERKPWERHPPYFVTVDGLFLRSCASLESAKDFAEGWLQGKQEREKQENALLVEEKSSDASGFYQPICRGSIRLGTDCGKCKKCLEEKAVMFSEYQKDKVLKRVKEQWIDKT